jgi:hypothetical protein
MPSGKSIATLDKVKINSPEVADVLSRYGIEKIIQPFPDFNPADTLRFTKDGKKIILINLKEHYKIRLAPGEDRMALVNAPSHLHEVRLVEPCHRVILETVIPNDEYFNTQWGVHNTGQGGGTSDEDIDAPEAWQIHKGSSNVKIGIIDTGVDEDHLDLRGNVSGDVGITDDHGTHVAGIAAAKTNNGEGISGVEWYAQTVSEKVDDFKDPELYNEIIEEVDAGADVLNNTQENDNSVWNIVGRIGLSRYRLSTQVGISAGVGMNWNFKPNILLRVSLEYDHTKRDLFLEGAHPCVYPADSEIVHDYSLKVVSLLLAQNFFIGVGPSLHYYSLFRTGSGAAFVGNIFPEGKDTEIAITLTFLLGTMVNIDGTPFSLGLELMGNEDFKDRWSRRSLSFGIIIYYWQKRR